MPGSAFKESEPELVLGIRSWNGIWLSSTSAEHDRTRMELCFWCGLVYLCTLCSFSLQVGCRIDCEKVIEPQSDRGFVDMAKQLRIVFFCCTISSCCSNASGHQTNHFLSAVLSHLGNWGLVDWRLLDMVREIAKALHVPKR